ncbi:MAG: ice-binding family protein [Candidatus Cloacimonadaceae bacterium]|nr:ice-binding family protein [Candidatus Cloacimonadaceae bacterium]
MFQIAQGIEIAPGANVILTGGAQAKNVFWQTFGTVSLGDDALIIVGRILNTRDNLPDNLGLTKLSANKDVSYSRLNKSQYIRNLRSCFLKNSFVRIEFSDFRVQRHPVHDYVFGIQMHQKWRSSTYNDDGYLFLVIDLRDVKEPLIWVRTWQPEKSIRPGEAFELGHFIIE